MTIHLAARNGPRPPSFRHEFGEIIGPHGAIVDLADAPTLICATASQAIQLRAGSRIATAVRFEADARALLRAFEEAREWRSAQAAARAVVSRKGQDWAHV